MNPTLQTWYQCPYCQRMHREHEEAEGCCSEPIESCNVWICSFCQEYHYRQADAEDCCKGRQGEQQ